MTTDKKKKPGKPFTTKKPVKDEGAYKTRALGSALAELAYKQLSEGQGDQARGVLAPKRLIGAHQRIKVEEVKKRQEKQAGKPATPDKKPESKKIKNSSLSGVQSSGQVRLFDKTAHATLTAMRRSATDKAK